MAGVDANSRRKWNWRKCVYFWAIPIIFTTMERAHFGHDSSRWRFFFSPFIRRCIRNRFVVTGEGDTWKSNRTHNSLNNISNVTERIVASEQVFEYIYSFSFSFDWQKMYLCVAISTWKVLQQFFFLLTSIKWQRWSWVPAFVCPLSTEIYTFFFSLSLSLSMPLLRSIYK